LWSAAVTPAASHVANVNAKTLRIVLTAKISRKSHPITDYWRGYTHPGLEFASHGVVNRSQSEFFKGGKHSNTAENSFSIFKRGGIGIYHQVSEAHMHRYCAEFDFPYTTRMLSDTERTAEAVKGARVKRLMYRQPCSLAA
jgi:hypothetical protein